MFGLIRKLIPLVIAALIGWVVYVSFYGTDEERAMRDNLFNSAKQVGQSIGQIFNHESEKFEQGTYDDAINTLSDALNNLRDANNSGDDAKKADYEARLAELEKERQTILAELNTGQQKRTTNGEAQRNKEAEAKMEALAKKIESLGAEMEKSK